MSERLEAAGLAFASVRAIERWKARNSIPSHRLTALLLLAERDGARLDLYQYLTPGGR